MYQAFICNYNTLKCESQYRLHVGRNFLNCSNRRYLLEKQNKNKYTTISINDTGIGIAPENISRIFDPFFSGGHDLSKNGTGLGLSITKSIVEKCGGSIAVSSTLGAGSCFTLSFPPIKKLAKK